MFSPATFAYITGYMDKTARHSRYNRHSRRSRTTTQPTQLPSIDLTKAVKTIHNASKLAQVIKAGLATRPLAGYGAYAAGDAVTTALLDKTQEGGILGMGKLAPGKAWVNNARQHRDDLKDKSLLGAVGSSILNPGSTIAAATLPSSLSAGASAVGNLATGVGGGVRDGALALTRGFRKPGGPATGVALRDEDGPSA